jgi:hypothetical protein
MGLLIAALGAVVVTIDILLFPLTWLLDPYSNLGQMCVLSMLV